MIHDVIEGGMDDEMPKWRKNWNDGSDPDI